MAQRISRAKAHDQGGRRDRSPCPRPTGCAERLRVRVPRAVPDLQRGLRPQRRHRAGVRRPLGRGHPPGPLLRATAPDRPRGDRAARADAAHRRAPRQHAPAPQASWSRWPNRTARAGTGRSSPKACSSPPTPSATERWASTRSQAAIAALHDEAPRHEDDGLAPNPRPLPRARAHGRQPDGHAQPRRRRRHGRRSRRRAWPSSTASTPGSATTIASTPCAPTSSRCRGTPRRPPPSSAPPRHGRPTCASATTSS